MAERMVSIGVHIWVPGKVGFPGGKPEIENVRGYVAARNRRLAEGPRDQVLMIVDNYFADTVRRLELGSEWDGHLIRTHMGSPRPKEMKPQDLRELILRDFPADVYEYWGTEVYLKKGRIYNGCVKGAGDILKLPNSRIDLSCCLVKPAPKGNPWRKFVEGALSSGWSMP